MLLAACARHAPSIVDPTLPEETPELPAELSPLDVLVAAADDLDPTPRARALRQLVEHTDAPAGGSWSQRALLDPSPWVQRAGVEGLRARLSEPESVTRLEAYVERDAADPYVRGLAARALGPDSRVAREAMERARRAARRPWGRAPLAFAAAVLGDAEALEPLARDLASGELALETDFLLAIGESGLTGLLPALREAGDAVEEELELPVAAARLALGDREAEPLLRRALLESDVERGFEAIDVLAHLEHPAADDLLRRARNNGPGMVRRYAELVLAARAADPVPLLRAATDPDPELRSLAMRFAAEMALRAPEQGTVVRQARRVVERGLADELPNVRLAALDAATRVDLGLDASLLRDNLNHPLEAIRLGAAGALLAHPPAR